MLFTARRVCCAPGLSDSIPSTAKVPMTVAISEARMAIENVFTIAPSMSLLWNISWYHFSENLVNTDIERLSLNDRNMSVKIGRYRKSIIIIKYMFPKNFFIINDPPLRCQISGL